MYSLGMLGSCLEKMVLSPTSLCAALSQCACADSCRLPCHVLWLAVVDNVSKLYVPLVLKLLKVLLTLAVGAWSEAKLCEGVVCGWGHSVFLVGCPLGTLAGITLCIQRCWHCLGTCRSYFRELSSFVLWLCHDGLAMLQM